MKSVRGRSDLGDKGLERLECLLGEIAVEFADLLRFSDERLVRGLCEFGLNLDGLLHRLHAGELFNEGLGVFERLLGVFAVGIVALSGLI